MRTFRPEAWLPTTKKEVEAREWDYIDVILFSGDAYVDHPSFGAAVIGRTLEAMGLRVAIVPQPDWRGDYRDFKKLGAPRLFFGVSAGAMDSMINHYTANKRLRSDDAYTPDRRAGMRPDYPSIVYTKIFLCSKHIPFFIKIHTKIILLFGLCSSVSLMYIEFFGKLIHKFFACHSVKILYNSVVIHDFELV